MGEIYEKMRALAIHQKEVDGYSKETQRQGMMIFWNAILDDVYADETKHGDCK